MRGCLIETINNVVKRVWKGKHWGDGNKYFTCLLWQLLIVFILCSRLLAQQDPGTVKWKVQLDSEQVYAEIAITPKGLICLLNKEEICAIGSDGTETWSLDLPMLLDQIFRPLLPYPEPSSLHERIFVHLPVVSNDDGVLFFTFSFGHPDLGNNWVMAVNDSGEVNWYVDLGKNLDDGFTNKPLIDKLGNIYIASESGVYSVTFFKIDKDGSVLNSAIINTTGDTPFAQDDDRLHCDLVMLEGHDIYFGSRCLGPDPQGSLRALDSTFTALWSYPKLGHPEPHFALDSRANIYVQASPFVFPNDASPHFEPKLEMLDENGEKKWSYPGSLGPPVIDHNHTIYSSLVDTLFAFSQDGEILWSKVMSSKITSPILIGDVGVLYFGCANCSLYAIDTNRNTLWSIRLEEQIQGSPSIDHLGNLYVLTSNNILYAINTESNGLDSLCWPKIYHDAQNTGFLPFKPDTTKPDTTVEEYPPDPETPKTFQLLQNYPNPFYGETEIQYQIPADPRYNHVQLNIYDTRGRMVRQLVKSPQAPGTYSICWDGTNSTGKPVASGVYVCTIQTGGVRKSRKLLLLK